MKRPGWVAAVVILAGLGFWLSPSGPEGDQDRPFELQALLGDGPDAVGFERAARGHRLRFPRDHRQHPGYRNEWWYLTGQLRDRDDPARRFGYQLTLFRFALAPPGQLSSRNAWIDPQFYMGHFAITDITAGKHHAVERFSRRGPGLAGAEGVPIRIWLTDWQLQSQSPQTLFPLRLRAAAGDMALELRLSALKPLLLQGEQGFSRKNAAGGASYYYSYPRLQGEGRLSLGGRHYAVQGLSWYDHEWSSNSLTADQVGWDWFSLQLDDGRDLMFYRFRDRHGGEGLRQLALVDARGERVELAADAVDLEALGQWLSPTGRRYPSGWRLRIPAQELDLIIEPLVDDQEMRLSVTYWEGAVAVRGSHRGRGYVELAGY